MSSTIFLAAKYERRESKYADALTKLQQQLRDLRQRKVGDVRTDEEKLAAASRLGEIIADLEELQKAHPQSSELHYNRACGLAQLDEAGAAIAELRASVKSGWWDYRQTVRDDDLKSLRGRDDFKTLLDEMKSIDFDVQPAIGFRSSVGWLPNGMSTADEMAPRYLLSTVLACTTGRGTSVDQALANLPAAVRWPSRSINP